VSEQKPPSSRVSAYARLLGNPYAKDQLFDPSALNPAPYDTDLRPLTNEERAYVRELQNQYAPLSIAIADDDGRGRNALSAKAQTRRHGVSKQDFEQECRRIFRKYIPALERGRLRPHHAEFISRNRSRNALQREALVAHLRKFDLSEGLRCEGHFNRGESLTERKLKQIETKVLGSE
jgi:hypothetical protein